MPERADAPLELGLSRDDPVHYALLPTDEGPVDKYAHAMVTMRDHVKDLPKTAATFAMSGSDGRGVYEKAGCDGLQPERLHELAFMLGAWRLPEGYTHNRMKFVNPNYAHCHKYADIHIECDCGRAFGEVVGGHGAVAAHPTHHDEDCRPESRAQAKRTLRTARIAWLRKCARNKLSRKRACSRLGVSPKTASRVLQGFPASYTEWLTEGKTIAANTIVLLNRYYGIDAQLVADAYGLSRRTVWNYTDECDREWVERIAPGTLDDCRGGAVSASNQQTVAMEVDDD